MGVRNAVIAALLALAAVCAPAQDSTRPPAAQGAPSAGDQQADPASQGTSSSKGSRKNSDPQQPPRHVRVPVDDDPTAAELAQAEKSIQKQDFDSAQPLLAKIVARDPKNYEAWFDLGFVQNALGRVDDSIAAYRKSVANKPDVFESNLNLGLQLAKTGQPDAEQFLRAATLLKPTAHAAEGQYRAWLSLGHVLEKSKPEEALAAFRRAASLQPKEAEPHLSAGLALERANQFAEAEREYQQALALSSNSPDALIGLANIYLRGRRFPEAEEYLRKLLGANPDSAAAHLELGRVLAAEEKYDDAITEMQAGIKLAPADSSAQRDLADLYFSANKNDQAEKVYRPLLAASPNDAQLHQSLGRALLRERKFPEAQQEFLAAIKLKPDSGEVFGDLAFAASENKDYALTIKALDARLRFLPDSANTYFLRASAYDHLRDLKQAAVNYHRFLETANGKYPDQEWQAKHRLIAIEPKK